jgi:putative membrane fusion protein
METAKKVYRRKRNNRMNLGRFIIFVLICAYIIMFVYTFFAQNIDETINITYGTVEAKELVTGYITRNEKIVSADILGGLYPVVLEGERVSKNQKVAVVKNENSDNIEEKIKEIKNKLSLLTTPTIFNNDIKLLENDVNYSLNSLMLSNYNENFSNLSSIRNKIEDKLSKKALIIGESGAKGTLENEYYEEIKRYESQLTNSREELTAPIAGTVAYKLDGYESVFSYNAIGDYDVETLEKMNVPSGELVGTTKQNSFKIVDNIEGYVTVISSSKEALNARVDKKLKLRFPEISNEEISGRIEYLTIEDDKAVLTFRINRMLEDLINYRKTKVEMIWNSSEGLLVPSSAIKHEEDGSAKIYVINGRRAIEKSVDVVLDNGEQAIINSKDGYVIILYDRIAKDAADISENKIIISN